MSVKKQVFWLRGHPTGFTFPSALRQWHVEAFVARYSGATAQGSHPLPYSPPANRKGHFLTFHTTHCVAFQRTIQPIVIARSAVNSLFWGIRSSLGDICRHRHWARLWIHSLASIPAWPHSCHGNKCPPLPCVPL